MKRFKTIAVLLIVLLGVLLMLNISLGSVYISVSELLNVVLGRGGEPSELIVLNHRLPKAITAICVGSALSVSGLLMQSMFRNALAGPFVLGISNGASLGVALLMMFPALIGVSFFSGVSILIASVIGAVFVFSLVLSVSMFLNDNLSLLIVGIMLGSITGALVSVLQYFSKAEVVQSYLVWTFGSLGGLSWTDVMLLSLVVGIGLMISVLLIKGLNAILLGDVYAQGVGVNVKKTKRWVMLTTCLLAGGVTAYCGPIAFVGLAVPHIAKFLCKTSNHNILIPISILIGACLMLLCDIIAQVPMSSVVLPINAITALFGAPVVIWVILGGRSKNQLN